MQKSIKPGDVNPKNKKQTCVVCPSNEHKGDRRRWLTNTATCVPKDAGHKKPCRSCAAKLQAKQRPDSRRGRLIRGKRRLLCGTVQRLQDREEQHYKDGTTPADCGICNRPFTDKKANNERKVSYCKDCEPWVAVALRPEQCNVKTPERDAAYAKIKRAVLALLALKDDPPSEIPPPGQMPFYELVHRYAWQRPNASPWNRGTPSSYKIRHLALFFEQTPIGKIDLAAAGRFKNDYLTGSNRLGPRQIQSARRMLDVLWDMIEFAGQKSWIKSNSGTLRRPALILPAQSDHQRDRIMTVDEEARLHAACSGGHSYLKAVLLGVADVPAALREFLRLLPSDVNLDENSITVRTKNGKTGESVPRKVKITPRLSSALRETLNSLGLRPDQPIFLSA